MTKHNSMIATLALTLLFALAVTFPVNAQEGQTTPSFESGPYVFNLGLTAGYRNTDVTDFDGNKSDWATNRFYEMYNQRSGINLNSFDLYGERKGADGFFDEMFVTASGINDPFTTGSLRMRAFNSYDLKVDFRQAKYFLNRDDSIFTGLHKYDMTRDLLDASLDINATEDLKVNLKLNSISRSGDMTTTMSPFIEDGETLIGSYVGGIYRGDFYWINVPKNDKTTEFSAGLTYKLPAASSIALGGGLRSFTQEFSPTIVSDTALTYGGNIANAFSGIRGYSSPVVGKNYAYRQTPFEPLLGLNYTDHRESSGPFVYFQGVTKPVDEMTVTADLRYESSTSKPTVTYDMNGIARTGATITYDTLTGAPTNFDKVKAAYSATFSGLADKMDWNSLTANVALSGKLMEALSATATFSMSNINEDVHASHDVTITADTGTKVLKPITATGTGELSNTYKIPQQTIDGFLSYTPMIEGFGSLGIKAGVKYMDRKPDITVEDARDQVLSREISAITPYVAINLRPMSQLRLDARLSQTTRSIKDSVGNSTDMPIRTAPEKILNISGGISYQPIERMNLAVRYAGVNGTSTFNAVSIPWTSAAHAVNLPELDYTNDNSSITASFGYFFKEIKLGFQVSGQYKENKYSIPTTWTRGNIVPTNYPGYIDSMTVLVSQNTIDRYLDCSLTWEPVAALHLEGGLALTRSTGEPSTFVAVAPGIVGDSTHFGGPYSMQNIHVAAAYDVTPNIGVNVDFQHVAYKEDHEANFWAVNNFAGNLIRGGFALKF
ncbi:MAG: hypothetical protein Q8921_02535 [Bacteroidota bacterium]|nr:hypothetical protein [Bacteroidota bacterium]